MILKVAIAYAVFALLLIAAWIALVFAVVTDTYANWIVREQKRQHARRKTQMRGSMREQNFVAAKRGS